jgi:hypothetical protein
VVKRRLRWAGYVAGTKGVRTAYTILIGKPAAKDNSGD